MHGNARPWRDELGDAISLQQSGTGISRNLAEGSVEFAHNATYHATFSQADALITNAQLNHDKDLASSIFFHIHWWQEKAYVPNFLVEYRWQINLGTKVTSWTKLKCTSLAIPYSSGSIDQICFSPGIAPPPGSALSDIVQFRLYRDTTNASGEFTGNTDPYNTGGNAAASVLFVDPHFQINSLGSTDEYVK